jgi:hypothetical protein
MPLITTYCTLYWVCSVKPTHPFITIFIGCSVALTFEMFSFRLYPFISFISERVSDHEWLLFYTNSAIVQLYHGENKLIFNEMMMRSALYWTNTLYNMSEWGDISIRGLLFQWVSTIKIQLSVLVQYKADLIIISLKINLFSPWYSWTIAELV